jgi:predicted nucleotidyltransferase/predicted transcriptional regulator
MQFRDFTRKALGSEGRVRVLLYLFKNSAPASEREIARILGLSNTAVNKIMKDFSDIYLVSPMRIGAAQVWHLNEQSYAYSALQDMKKIAELPPLEHLKRTISEGVRNHAIKKAIVFGSVAEGKEMPSSDIDLFILIERGEVKKSVAEKLTKLALTCQLLYGNSLSIAVMTEKEARSRKNLKFMESVSKGIQVI